MRLFRNRHEAALELARHLDYLKNEQPIVLGLADGGVPLAQVIAEQLDAPLDILLIERLSAPQAPDHVVGAVDEHGRISMIQATARWHHLTTQQMVEPAREAFREIQRRRAKIRAILPEVNVHGRTVIVVSQGVATGAKMLGAVASVKDRGASKVIAASPAGAEKAIWQLHDSADEVVIPHRPSKFRGVDRFYEDYAPVTPDMTLMIIERWLASRPPEGEEIRTFVTKVTNETGQLLCCEIDLPPGMQRGSPPVPSVVFAHGLESDARSARNVEISRRLAKRGIVGVRMDFTGHGRSEGRAEDASDHQMLQDLRSILSTTASLEEVDPRRIGLCGSGTGGMVALYCAASEPLIRALVIRGPVCGQEVEAARRVKAPTLLIHAERDTALVETIESLDSELGATHELLRIPNSSRVFNDPISRELMVSATVDWLVDHLSVPPSADEPPARAAAPAPATEQQTAAPAKDAPAR
ncbi:MAG: alpha/beta fold hydrolase [Planctomycetota bacterium]